MTRRIVIEVRALSARSTRGIARLGGCVWRCAMGKSGRSARKREGDGATPLGRMPAGDVLYRPDRTIRPPGRRVRAITRNDGWCDAPGDRNYNRAVRHPYPVSAERLWREDGLYDVVIVLGHNVRPRKRGHGSAIFIHAARPGYTPTEGCIAFAPRDLRMLAKAVAGRGAIVSTDGVRRRITRLTAR